MLFRCTLAPRWRASTGNSMALHPTARFGWRRTRRRRQPATAITLPLCSDPLPASVADCDMCLT
eukprot:m.43969 g.43969  ORF g.43969 m.43969 type:complete len:64 (-) comp8485_c0_seq2:735-926(-)